MSELAQPMITSILPEQNVVEQRSFRIPTWLIALVGFLALMIVLWLPFGIKETGIAEEWAIWNNMDLVPTRFGALFPNRPFELETYALAYNLTPGSWIGLNLMQIAFLLGKGFLLYLLVSRLLPGHTALAFVIGVLLILYPADTAVFTLRVTPIHGSIMFYLLSLYWLIIYWQRPRWFLLIGIFAAQLLSLGIYEDAIPLMLVSPVLLFWLQKRITWRIIRVTILWYILPAFFLFLLIYYLKNPTSYQGTLLDAAGLGPGLRNIISHASSGLFHAYSQNFVIAWISAIQQLFSNIPNLLLACLGVLLLVAFIVWFQLRDDAAQSPIGGTGNTKRLLIVALMGAALVAVGYVLYLPTPWRETTWRVFLFSSIGSAVVVGIVAFLISRVFGKQQPLVFATLSVILIGVATVNSLNQHQSYFDNSLAEQSVMAKIVEQVPNIIPGTTVVIVDSAPYQIAQSFPNVCTVIGVCLQGDLQVIYDTAKFDVIYCAPGAEKTFTFGQAEETCDFGPDGVTSTYVILNSAPSVVTRNYGTSIIFENSGNGLHILNDIQKYRAPGGQAVYNPALRIDATHPTTPRAFTAFSSWPFQMPNKQMRAEESVQINAPQNVQGYGWQYRTFTWTLAKDTTLDLLLKPDQDYSINFHVFQGITPEVLASLKLSVNGQPINLSSRPAEAIGTIFQGQIPRAAVNLDPTNTRLTFSTSSVLTPKSLGMSQDTVAHGVQFDWLRIDPQQPSLFLPMLLCLLCAAGVSYLVARKLFPASLLDTFACGFLLLMTILIGAMLSMGMINHLEPTAVVITTLALCGGLLLLYPRLLVLSPAPVTQPERHLSLIDGALLVGMIIATVAILLPIANFVFGASIDGDAVMYHIPNTINFIKAQTLWYFDGAFMFYPYNYELLQAWGLMFGHSYALLGVVHLAIVVGILFYSALLLNLCTRKLPATLRILGGVVLVLAILATRLVQETILQVGKNDLLIGLCALAGLYYLARYWQDEEPRHNGYLLLVGLVSGLMIGTKPSGAYWLGAYGLIHGLLLLRSKGIRFWHWLPFAIRHLLYVLIPVAIFGGVWGMRVALGYHLKPDEQYLVTAGFLTTILQRFGEPLLWTTTSQWIGTLLLSVGGAVLIIIPGPANLLMTGRRLIGIMLIGYGVYLVLQPDLFDNTYLGPLVIGIVVTLLIGLGHYTAPKVVSESVFIMALFTLFSFAIFAITPFGARSAASFQPTPDDIVIANRYNIAGFLLVLITLTGLGAQIINAALMLVFKPRSGMAKVVLTRQPNLAARALKAVSRPMIERRVYYFSATLFFILLILIPPTVRVFSYQAWDTLAGYDTWFSLFPEPSSVYNWAQKSLSNTKITVEYLPSYGFYGPTLSNRVYLIWGNPEQDTSKFADFIDHNQIEYLVFGLFSPYKRGPLPSDELTKIIALKKYYPVAFEDAQAIIFATKYAHPTFLEYINYEFDTPTVYYLYGEGWLPPEVTAKGESFRWSSAKVSTLHMGLATDQDLKISFRIVAALTQDIPASLVLRVNDVPIKLTPESGPEGGTIFTGIIPKTALEKSPGTATLAFEVNRVVSAKMLGVGEDTRLLGLAFDWLRIGPNVPEPVPSK